MHFIYSIQVDFGLEIKKRSVDLCGYVYYLKYTLIRSKFTVWQIVEFFQHEVAAHHRYAHPSITRVLIIFMYVFWIGDTSKSIPWIKKNKNNYRDNRIFIALVQINGIGSLFSGSFVLLHFVVRSETETNKRARSWTKWKVHFVRVFVCLLRLNFRGGCRRRCRCGLCNNFSFN